MKDFTIGYGLKNFLKCLKYIFIPLGMLCLGAILGLSIAIPICQHSLGNLFDAIVNSAQDLTIDTNALRSEFMSVVGELNWSEPQTALQSITDKAWLTAALTRCMTALTGLDSFESTVEGEVEAAFSGIYTGVLVFFFFLILSFIGGYMLTKSLIRKELASRTFWKFIAIYIIHGLITMGTTALGIWLLSVWRLSVFIFSVGFFILISVLSMFEAYLVQGWRKVPAKKIVTTKNVAFKLLSDFIIFLVWAAIVALITVIFNRFAGMIIGIVIFEIASIVINLNAEAYVKSVATDD